MEMSVNTEKKKAKNYENYDKFRKGGKGIAKTKLVYSTIELEVMKCFNYLAIVFTSDGSFINAVRNIILSKAPKAMYRDIPVKIMSLLVVFVAAVIYSCEVWSFIRSDMLERVYRK